MKPTRRITVGIGGLLGHDANAALFIDGTLIGSAQEERFSRIKHDGTFPSNTITDCLNMGGVEKSKVTDVVFAEKSLQSHFFNLTSRPGNSFTQGLGHLLPESW